ncbi:MAG: hypothetical protein OXK20_10235 [Deltaproteobacteria bacterium]|nr:hypothetical protein [Deltaproteobacteria bacterium]
MGKSFAFLVLVAATVAVGYTAWETRNLRISLDRMAVGDETNITEVMISLAHAEGQLARIQEAVELLGGAGPAANASALEGKITTTLTAAQREVLQQELNKWAKQLEDRREKGLASLRQALEQKLSGSDAKAAERDKRSAELKALVEANQKNLTAQLQKLGDGLSVPPAAVKEQGEALTSLEKRLAAVLKATENNQKALTQRNKRDEERWKDVFLALEDSKEATQQRYAELAARLDRQRSGAQTGAGPAPTGQQGRAPSQPRETQIERERFAEFCREVPTAAECKNR